MAHRTVRGFLVIVLTIAAGCVAEQGIEKGKFAPALGAARELQASLTKGAACDIPDALLRKLVAETEALKAKAASREEKKVVQALSGLVATYNDGALLCGARNRVSEFKFVPKGRIHVFQDMDPLVLKYDLAVENHVYKPTGAAWKSVSEDSVKVIWESAETLLRNIENMVNYS